MAGTYRIVREADGNLRARSAAYDLKDGEEEVGTSEGANADEALQNFEEAEGDEETGLARREELSPEQAKQRDEERRQREEAAKQEFTVMADAEGHFYVEGEDDADPKKAKEKARAAAKAKKEDEEPVEVGKFRAKDAKEALAMAQGTYHDPAEGQPRGAQTP